MTAFAALADPSRRRILDLLREGERPVGELVDHLRVSQPAVSKQLRILRDEGLVGVRPMGRRRIYALRAAPLAEVYAWLNPYRKHWTERLDALEQYLEDNPVTEGTLEKIDGRPALRFTRHLAHPIERVWRAVSTYDELAAWFVVPVDFKDVGQHFEAMEQPGEVLRFEPPRSLEWEWGGERFSFDLEPDEDGTVLTFVHVFTDRDHGADYASGWHFHLDRLEAHLEGQRHQPRP